MMTWDLSNPTFTDTTSASGAENLKRQICGLTPKSQAVSMSFSLSAVWFDGTIVSDNPLRYSDPLGLCGFNATVNGGLGLGFYASLTYQPGQFPDLTLGGGLGIDFGYSWGPVQTLVGDNITNPWSASGTFTGGTSTQFGSYGGGISGNMNLENPMGNNNIQAQEGGGFGVGASLTVNYSVTQDVRNTWNGYSAAAQNAWNYYFANPFSAAIQ
jgi:hypothetical protein